MRLSMMTFSANKTRSIGLERALLTVFQDRCK
jgi:hypothetical protein